MISWLLRLGSKVRIKNWNFGAPESELWNEKLGWEPDPRQGFHRGFSVLGGRLRPGALPSFEPVGLHQVLKSCLLTDDLLCFPEAK